MATLFIDRDGVINVNRQDHVRSWQEFELLPGALQALAQLTAAGHRILLVTNQAIVNRGEIDPVELDEIHRQLAAAVWQAGGWISGILVCPHRPDERCRCRKPEPGLLFRGAEEYGASLDDALLIGDHFTDLEAARRAGCPSILVLSGRVQNWQAATPPDGCVAVVPDLLSAAGLVLGGLLPQSPVAQPLPAGAGVAVGSVLVPA
jgi:D-glycero-D-manno-heptose 1,7-bisphosphate phosphatase